MHGVMQALGEMDAEARYSWMRGKILRFKTGVFHSVFSKKAYDAALKAGATGACTINRPCAQQYVGKSQSCMPSNGRVIPRASYMYIRWVSLTCTSRRPSQGRGPPADSRR